MEIDNEIEVIIIRTLESFKLHKDICEPDLSLEELTRIREIVADKEKGNLNLEMRRILGDINRDIDDLERYFHAAKLQEEREENMKIAIAVVIVIVVVGLAAIVYGVWVYS